MIVEALRKNSLRKPSSGNSSSNAADGARKSVKSGEGYGEGK